MPLASVLLAFSFYILLIKTKNPRAGNVGILAGFMVMRYSIFFLILVDELFHVSLPHHFEDIKDINNQKSLGAKWSGR
jgi:hypothetical protein